MDSQQVVQALGNMTVMELCNLTRQLEAAWGVVAAPPQAITPVGFPGQDDVRAMEQTEFTAELLSVDPTRKIEAIKTVREVLGLGLVDAKKFVEAAPKVLKAEISKQDAEDIQKRFADAGGVVTVR